MNDSGVDRWLGMHINPNTHTPNSIPTYTHAPPPRRQPQRRPPPRGPLPPPRAGPRLSGPGGAVILCVWVGVRVELMDGPFVEFFPIANHFYSVRCCFVRRRVRTFNTLRSCPSSSMLRERISSLSIATLGDASGAAIMCI